MSLLKIFIGASQDELCSNIRRLVNMLDEVRVIGTASTGPELLSKVNEFKPHILIVDADLEGYDGYTIAENIARENQLIKTIIISKDSSAEACKKALQSGAKDFLAIPFSETEISESIKRIYEKWLVGTESYEKSQVAVSLCFYSAKGGIGKTILSGNLAAYLAKSGKKTLLVDSSLQFGDIALLTNVGTSKNISEIVNRGDYTLDGIEKFITHHESGLDILAAPRDPASAETVKAEDLGHIFDAVSPIYQYIIYDMPVTLTEKELVTLDKVDFICLLSSLEITAIKDAKICLKTFKDIGIDMNKVKVVLNKNNPKSGVSIQDFEEGLATEVFADIPYDPSMNENAELVIQTAPKGPVALAVAEMGNKLIKRGEKETDKSKPSLLTKLKALLLGK